ncbi:MAG: hypothetical protein IPG93_08670 [Burkholderiales bacterium]|nr:hypothetical protein [Burkholderiales bacterium]
MANTVAFTGSALADNYTLANPTESIAGQIDRATLTATNTAATTKTYDGNTAASITGTLSGLVNGETAGFSQSGTFDSANAGARTVEVANAVAFTGSALADNYTLANPTESVAGQIDKATLTATNTAAATKTYDGNTTASITGTLSGLVNGETAGFSQSGTFDSANAGARTVEVANTVAFTGSALADNYTLANPTESIAGQIDRATLTATNTAATTKTYDGNTAASITGTLSGLVNGETAGFSQSGTFDSANAGARTVEVANTVDFTGSALADNYTLANPTESIAGQIDRATLTATNTAATTKTYDGNTAASITGTLAGLVNGESLTFTQTGSFDSANAGARAVAVVNSVADNGAALASNYNLVNPTENVAGQIDKATLTATNTAAATKTYDGNTTASITGTLSGLVNGETAGFSQSGMFDSANAGARTVEVANAVAFNGSALADNYTLANPTESIAGQIDRATLTATNTAATTKTYDGNTTASITGTLAGLVNGESLTFTQTGSFDNANAGARAVAVVNSVADNGAALASNYNLVNPTENVAGQIDKATLTATNTAAATKTYDGNTTAAITGTLAGLVNGETLTFTQAGAFDSANAGARTVAVSNTVAFTGSALADNYTLANPTESIAGQIDRATLTATNTDAATKTYDGNTTASITGTLSGLVNGETAGFSQSGTFDSANAGARTVEVANAVAFNGSALADNYTLANPTESIAGQIDRATLTATNTAATTKTYDGNTTASITGTLAGLVNGESLTFTQTGSFDNANAGARAVAVVNSVADNGAALASNYNLVNPTENVAGQIDKATLTATNTAAATKTYDGNTTASITGTLSGLVNGETAGFSQSGTFDSANAGARTVEVANAVAFNGSALADNYTLANPTESVAGQIDKATLTATNTAAATKTYDGNTTASITGTLSGLVNGETAGFSQSGMFDSANAGARTVEVANAVAFTGSALADNYTLANPTENVAGQIDKATLTATNTAATTKTYDGNTAAAITGTLSGLVNGETAGFNQSGTFDSANAGARTVAVSNTVAFTGSALADNYTLANPTESIAGQIDRATLTATNTAATTKTYDGNTAASITGTLAGLVNGESLTFTQTGSFDNANAGARAVAVVNSVADNGAALASNYNLVNPTENVAGQIDKATLTATNTAAATKTYDGNTAAAITGTLSGLVNGETAGFSQSGTFDSANAGARTVEVANAVAFTGSALADNYTLANPTESIAGQIDRATLTATNTAATTKTYDGNTAAQVTGALAGLVNGETAGFSQSGTFDSANAGARTVEVANTVAFTGSALADNYTLANPTESIAGQIDRATLTATNTAATTKTYDGNTAASITGTLSGLVNGETAGFSQSGTFDSANAGARTVEVANAVAFTGSALADNYTLANPTESVAGQIDKATLTATNTAAATKTYDGNTTASITGTLSGLVNGETAGFSQSGTFDSANAGARTVEVANAVAFTGSALADNYTLANPTENVAGQIDKATLTATNTAAATKTYDGNTAAAITGTLSGLVNGETAGFSQSGSFDSANAGARTVEVANAVAFTGSALADNYTLANPTESVAGQIDKATVTATNTAATTKTYDGNTTAAITGTLAGLVNGETAVFSQSGTFDSANAGARTVEVANAVAFTGSALADNYTLVNPTENVAGQIDKATLTATHTAAATKTYDGNTAAAITGTLSGLVNGETAGFNQSGTFDSANAGARTVAVANTVAFTGSALADNYTLANPTESVAGQIDKATLTATVSAPGKTYDGTVAARPTLTITSGLVGNESVVISDATASFNSKDVLTAHTVTVDSVGLGDGSNGGLASNYQLSAGQTTAATVVPAPLGATASAADKVYDGNRTAAATLSITSGLVGTEALGTAATASFDSKDVATANTVTVDGVTLIDGANGGLASNYALAPGQTTTAHIVPATLTVADTAVAASKVYDGGVSAALTGPGRLLGVVGTEAVGLTQQAAYLDKNVGAAKPVELHNTLSGAADVLGNYVVAPGSSVQNFSADITPKALDVAGTTAANKVFDGNTIARVGGGSLTGVVAGDDVSLSQGGAFRDASAGSGKPVDIDNVLAGIDAFNYVLPPMHTTADILPDVAASRVVDSLKTADSRAAALAAGNDAGLQIVNLVPASAGGSTGGYVLAALPGEPAPVARLAAANVGEEIAFDKLPPTAAGPMSAAVQAVVPTPTPADLLAAAGMISSEGGARVNTRTMSGHRPVAPGSRAPARKPAGAARPDGGALGQGLARFGAGVTGAASTLGSLSLSGDAAGVLPVTPNGSAAAVPTPTVQAPVVPQLTPTPKRAPADSGSGNKGAIVFGSLFAAAAGYTLGKRFLKKKRA